MCQCGPAEFSASRQTELAERFPSHVVCDWLRNSEDIARKHYFQTTDDHFARAVDAAKAKQNPKQPVTVSSRDDSQPKSADLEIAEQNGTRRYFTKPKADGGGFEPPVRFNARQFSRLLP